MSKKMWQSHVLCILCVGNVLPMKMWLMTPLNLQGNIHLDLIELIIMHRSTIILFKGLKGDFWT